MSADKVAVIVEPDSSLSYVFGVVLKRKGFDVISDEKIEVALKRMKGKPVKVILIAQEARTKNHTGLEICRAINTAYRGRIPVIVTSRQATEENVIGSLRAGALDFLVKPTNEQILIKKVDSAMQRGNTQFIVADNVKELSFGENMSPSDKVDIVINEADEIRALPQAVLKITQVSDDDKSGAKAMEKAISSDPSITAMVLKRANSAFYKGKENITSIQKAVVRIGFNECRNMVLGTVAFKMFSKDDKSFGFNRLHFWLHSVAVAVICEMLSKKMNIKGAEDSFIAGLLHDFGKLLLDDYLSQDFQRALQLANINNRTIYESENNIFERTHSAVSKAVMEKWNFKAEIVNAVLRHHSVPVASSGAGIVAGLNESLFLANQLAKASLLGYGGDAISTPVPNGLWSAYKFAADQFDEAFIAEYFKKVADFLEFLGLTAKELGRTLELPKGQGKILFLQDPHQDHLSLTFFLQCQGFEVVTARLNSEIPENLELHRILIQVDNREAANETTREVLSKYPDVKMLCMTGKLNYRNNLIPDANLKIIRGHLDYQLLKIALN